MESESEKVVKWVKELLEKRDYEKITVEFPGYDTSGGYAAEVVFVNVNAEKNSKKENLQLIVKKNKENAALLDVPGMKQAYESETIIYSIIVPFFRHFAEKKNAEIFRNIPPCYGTICRENEYVIVMENLKAKGYKTHDLEITMDLKHLELVLEAYAKWHAFSSALNDEEKRGIFNWFKETSKLMASGKLFEMMVKSWQNELDWLINEYTAKNEAKFIEKIQFLKKISPDLYADCLNYENKECVVLRHGDSWNNNFLFHYGSNTKIPDNVVVIDWQVGLLGPPTADLVNFIFMNASREELEHLDELLRFYYEIFTENLRKLGGDPGKFPWDKFMESFKHYAPVGIVMMPLAAKMSHKGENGEKYDIAQSLQDGDFSGVFGTTLRDVEGCIARISGVLEYCIEHNYL